MSTQHIAAYGAQDIDSVKALELSVESDEAAWFAKIVKLQLGLDDDIPVTAVTYEEVDNMQVGHLVLVEYKTDVDKINQKAIQRTKDNQFLLEGKAYINNKLIKVLVFREHIAT